MPKGFSLKSVPVLAAAFLLCFCVPAAGADTGGGAAGDIEQARGLLPLLDSADTEVRLEALRGLLSLGWSFDDPEFSGLLEYLDDPAGRIRAATVWLAFAKGRRVQAKPVLLELLSHENIRCRESAAHICEVFGGQDPDYLAPLTALLDDEDQHVRWWGIRALGEQRDLPADLTGRLIEALNNDEYWAVRAQAATILGRFAADDAQVRDALVAALDDPSCETVDKVARALAPLGAAAAPAIPRLAQYLTNDCFCVNYRFIGDVLDEMSVDPGNRRLIIDDLIPLLTDQEAIITYRACKILSRIKAEDPRIHATALAMLDQDDHELRLLGTLLFCNLFTDDPATVDPLIALLGDKDKYVREQTALALTQRGSLAGAALPALITVLRDDYYVEARIEAAKALGAIGTVNAEVIGALNDATAGPQAEVAAAAQSALDELEGGA